MPANFYNDAATSTITGTLNVTSDARTGAVGKIVSDNGAFTSDGAGNITVTSMTGQSNMLPQTSTVTPPTLASNGTIATANLSISRVTTGGAVTGCILQAGTFAGQTIAVFNESGNSITMATAATSKVSSGTSNVISANTGNYYTWDSLVSPATWVCIGHGI
jgi:hypothetical protein